MRRLDSGIITRCTVRLGLDGGRALISAGLGMDVNCTSTLANGWVNRLAQSGKRRTYINRSEGPRTAVGNCFGIEKPRVDCEGGPTAFQFAPPSTTEFDYAAIEIGQVETISGTGQSTSGQFPPSESASNQKESK
jgi:hypothetical protein